MNESSAVDRREPSDVADAVPRTTASYSRVRDRTDELELFISGLLAFALLAVPGYLFDAWARSSLHTEGVYFQALWFAFSIGVGMCYVLAVALIIHLAVRGYWIGLIGLKSHFPKGIDWDRLTMLGPFSRAFLKQRDGGLDGTIERADRLATMLFSSTLLCVQTLAGTLVVAIVSLGVAMAIGAAFGDVDRITLAIVAVLMVSLLGLAMVPMLLEKSIARRHAGGLDTARQEKRLQSVLAGLQRVPMLRLLQTMQWTLQSNLRGRSFTVIYISAVMLAMVLAALQVYGSMKFSLFNRYSVMTEEAVDHGMLGAHYESLRSAHDQLLPYPMIPADTISASRLRLFIPHRPQRDNPVARQRCASGARNEAQGAQAATAAVNCMALLWTVQLDGGKVDLHDFVPMERRDLDMRGLVGYLPMADLKPGRHDLRLIWNADGGERGPSRRREYSIPFWYAPEP